MLFSYSPRQLTPHEIRIECGGIHRALHRILGNLESWKGIPSGPRSAEDRMKAGRNALAGVDEVISAMTKLRGQLADALEWKEDARP